MNFINDSKKKYSFWKGVYKAIISMIIIGLPIIFNILPSDILNMTLGGVLAVILNWAKIRYQIV